MGCHKTRRYLVCLVFCESYILTISCLEQTKDFKAVALNNSLHSSGIFSMHEVDGKIVTGGKDGNVIISQAVESGITLQQAFRR